MADDKNGRDAQAHAADRRRRERNLRLDLERGDEPEPSAPEPAEVPGELAAVEYPATGTAIVEAAGGVEVEIEGSTHRVESLVPDADAETFESVGVVAARLGRPNVATVLKRVVEAADEIQGLRLDGGQRDAYEKTFRAVERLEPSVLEPLGAWAVERIQGKGTLPGSRGLRREAAKRCRAAGHEISNNDWLGV